MPDVPEVLSLLLALFAGAGVAAGCGFRAAPPLLVLGLLARGGHVALAAPCAWLASDAALGALALAALLEASLGPLRERAGPLPAVAAGALATAALLAELAPLPAAFLGLVLGGGIAAAVRAAVRSAGTSRGPVAEVLVAVLVASIALYAPITAPMIVAALLAGALHLRRERRRAA